MTMTSGAIADTTPATPAAAPTTVTKTLLQKAEADVKAIETKIDQDVLQVKQNALYEAKHLWVEMHPAALSAGSGSDHVSAAKEILAIAKKFEVYLKSKL